MSLFNLQAVSWLLMSPVFFMSAVSIGLVLIILGMCLVMSSFPTADALPYGRAGMDARMGEGGLKDDGDAGAVLRASHVESTTHMGSTLHAESTTHMHAEATDREPRYDVRSRWCASA